MILQNMELFAMMKQVEELKVSMKNPKSASAIKLMQDYIFSIQE